MPGTLFVVATPIGNLEDITVRALRVLREVAVIAAEDTRRTGHLLARHAIVTPTTSLHEHNEATKTPALIARLQRGDDVALVSDAGTPTISDPGGHLVRQAMDAGIRVEPIPGPSATMAALAVSGLPTETFTFFGFPPVRAKARKEWFQRVRGTGGTVVFFEAPHRIRETLHDLQRWVGDCEVTVARELTKSHEELVNGPISVALGRLTTDRGEFTIVAAIPASALSDDQERVSQEALAAEVGELTINRTGSKRRAIATIARRHGMAPNEVYAAIEATKKSG